MIEKQEINNMKNTGKLIISQPTFKKCPLSYNDIAHKSIITYKGVQYFYEWLLTYSHKQYYYLIEVD